MSFLRFSMVRTSPSGKTDIWRVENTSGTVLGVIAWHAPWRRYTFSPDVRMTFDAACLREIANYCDGATDRHKSARVGARSLGSPEGQ